MLAKNSDFIPILVEKNNIGKIRHNIGCGESITCCSVKSGIAIGEGTESMDSTLDAAPTNNPVK